METNHSLVDFVLFQSLLRTQGWWMHFKNFSVAPSRALVHVFASKRIGLGDS
jgi:hypothetical protein